MKAFISIIAVDGDRVAKYQDFDTQAEAEAHTAEYSGLFAAASPTGNITHYKVVSGALVLDPPPAPPPDPLTKLTISDRFTDAEIDIVSALSGGTMAKKRFYRAWLDATEIQPDDPRVVGAFKSLFGDARAAALLAPK